MDQSCPKCKNQLNIDVTITGEAPPPQCSMIFMCGICGFRVTFESEITGETKEEREAQVRTLAEQILADLHRRDSEILNFANQTKLSRQGSREQES